MRGGGLIKTTIPVLRPLFKVVAANRVAEVVARRVETGKHSRLLGPHRECRACSSDLHFTAPHCHQRRIASRVHVDSIGTRPEERDGAVWRVDLEALLLVEVADSDLQ